MDSPPTAQACLNCQAPLAADQRFCGACGQRVVHGRLTLGEIAHDLVHAFTHADRSIFALLRGLVTRPGHVARDYVAGRRKRYFGPFAFLVISVGIASFATYLAGVEWFAPVPDDSARAVLARHFNLVILAQVPLIAVACSLLFRGARLNFSEHLVFAAYTSGLRALLLAFVEMPAHVITGISTSDPRLVAPYFVAWLGYFAFASAQFYGGRPWWAALRGIFAVLLAQAGVTLLVFVFIYLHYRFGGP